MVLRVGYHVQIAIIIHILQMDVSESDVAEQDGVPLFIVELLRGVAPGDLPPVPVLAKAHHDILRTITVHVANEEL